MKKLTVIACLLVLSVVLTFGCRPRAVAPDSTGGLRVVSLAPSMTEMVCAVGGRDLLVGRTTACTYPPEVADVAVVGGFGAPSLETLIALGPDLVLDVDLEDPTLGRKLSDLGLRRANIACIRLDDVPAALETLGQLLDRRERAAALAGELRGEIARLREAAAGNPQAPTVFVEIWGDPVTSVGGSSYISELVELAGGRNVARDIEKDYFQVAPEWVLQRDPDIILCFYMSEAGNARETVGRRPGWDALRAVRTGRVYDGFDNDVILRPGPRVLQGVAALRRVLVPVAEP